MTEIEREALSVSLRVATVAVLVTLPVGEAHTTLSALQAMSLALGPSWA
jgi:hypothetical protein